jgi:hypothetical protein
LEIVSESHGPWRSEGNAQRFRLVSNNFREGGPAREPGKRRDFVLASSRLSHRGWQAETAALAVAEAAALATRSNGFPEVPQVFDVIRSLSDEQEWLEQLA